MKIYAKPDILKTEYPAKEPISSLATWLENGANEHLADARITNYCVES